MKVEDLKFKVESLKLKVFGSRFSINGYLLLLASCVMLLTFLNSCKVNYTFSGATIPPQAKTVSVQYFSNQASLSNPTYSQLFTEALRDIFQTQTNLAQTDKNGDIAFEGAVTGYATAPVSIQSNDQAALNRLTITVSVKYKNKYDESKNFESNFSRFADYQSTKSLTEVEAELIKQINDQLVQDIFNRALNNW